MCDANMRLPELLRARLPELIKAAARIIASISSGSGFTRRWKSVREAKWAARAFRKQPLDRAVCKPMVRVSGTRCCRYYRELQSRLIDRRRQEFQSEPVAFQHVNRADRKKPLPLVSTAAMNSPDNCVLARQLIRLNTVSRRVSFAEGVARKTDTSPQTSATFASSCPRALAERRTPAESPR